MPQEEARIEKRVMDGPLWVMMGVTVVLGWLATGYGGAVFCRFFCLEETFHFDATLFVVTQLSCAAAAALAWFSWGGRVLICWRIPALENLLARKYFVDDFYEWVVRVVFLHVCQALNLFDKIVINGLVNLTGRSVVVMGRVCSRIEWGEVQFYLGCAFGTVTLIAAYLMWM